MNFLGRLFALIILLLFLSKPVAAFKCAAIETYAGGGPDSLFANSANLRSPSGVAVDSIGNYYIAAYGQHRIFKVDITGRLTVVAGNGISGFSGDGGLATSACLSSPRGVAMDVAGNLYIADQDNHRIRKVDTTGVITTVAGNDDYGYSGDGGLATAASLRKPSGVTVDSSGNLYIADSYN